MKINKVIFSIGMKGWIHFGSDISYLKLMYRCKMGKELDIINPKTFNEKLQWLKIYEHNKIETILVDKLTAKDYVAEKIGENYIVPTLGVWNSFEEINFEILPEQFVIKCNHDSGGVVICKNKYDFKYQEAKKKIKKCLMNNYFWVGREWQYKNITPKIIVEKYLLPDSDKGLMDYKFYCFDGKPQFIYISIGLDNHSTAQISFVTMDWAFAKFSRDDYQPFSILPPKPKKFEEMIQIAEKLSEGFRFCRVDLYCVNENVYFSEMTFCPCSGFMKFVPDKYDKIVGNMLNLDI